jgi:hypothetical protein
MNRLCSILLLQLATVWTHGQSPRHNRQADKPKQADALVQSFYNQIVVLKPYTDSFRADWKILIPYFSKGLRSRLEDARACAAGYDRQTLQRQLKVPEKSLFSLESGLFSNNDEPGERLGFQTERVEPQEDRSFLVYVKLHQLQPPPVPWEVAARVVWEKGRPAIDDIIYLDDVDESLSKLFVHLGCEGSRWRGY